VAQTQGALVAAMPNHSKFFDKIEKADIPQRVRESLRLSLSALFEGYDQEVGDPDRIEPNSRSLARMLSFLAHPYHRVWRAPGITLSGDGLFAAVWQQPGNFRWIIEFDTDGSFEEIYLAVSATGEMTRSSRKGHVGEFLNPPFPENQLT
jgi:hypothetical protein